MPRFNSALNRTGQDRRRGSINVKQSLDRLGMPVHRRRLLTLQGRGHVHLRDRWLQGKTPLQVHFFVGPGSRLHFHDSDTMLFFWCFSCLLSVASLVPWIKPQLICFTRLELLLLLIRLSIMIRLCTTKYRYRRNCGMTFYSESVCIVS